MKGERRKVLILGAAGRDFHNFNCLFRDNPDFQVVAFTATQIPDIENRVYPHPLAGDLYPSGIPILPESEMCKMITELKIDDVVFSYSDVSNQYVMERAAMALSSGARFILPGPEETSLKSKKPVISVCAVRTGSGKSQTSRYVATFLRARYKRVAIVRHPMPYGDLLKQRFQRFEKIEDLDVAECTIEEREEYEPHIETGGVVFAGVDYHVILKEAENACDVILWDGGNNDLPFFRPNLHIVVVDPFRAGHETLYHPGLTNLMMAHVVVINKVNTAEKDKVESVKESIKRYNPKAEIIEAASDLKGDDVSVKGKKVLVVEDGPTITHGEMPFGAGFVWARNMGADIVDPRPYAKGSIIKVYEKYPHIGLVLPAMGYSEKQIEELSETIEASEVDAVIVGTPINLGKLLSSKKPFIRVRYEFRQVSGVSLEKLVSSVL